MIFFDDVIVQTIGIFFTVVGALCNIINKYFALARLLIRLNVFKLSKLVKPNFFAKKQSLDHYRLVRFDFTVKKKKKKKRKDSKCHSFRD